MHFQISPDIWILRHFRGTSLRLCKLLLLTWMLLPQWWIVDHRTHYPSTVLRYACAIRGIVRGARGCIKAATCWAARIPPIRFRRGYFLLDDEKGRRARPSGRQPRQYFLYRVTSSHHILGLIRHDLNDRRGTLDQVSRSAPLTRVKQ